MRISKERSLNRADYPQILQNQIERIEASFNEGNRIKITNNIIGLEAIVVNMIDNKYRDHMKTTKERYNKEKKSYIRGLRRNLPSSVENNLKFLFFQDKFNALIKLIDRKGLLTKMAVMHSDEDDDGQPKTFPISDENSS